MNQTERPIKCTFNWDILAGKTLEISVGTDLDSHAKAKTICVIGRDKTTGVSYVLHQEMRSLDND